MISITPQHPLRKLFRSALDFGFSLNTLKRTDVAHYLEAEILSEFLHVDNLFKIRDATGKRLEDIADILAEGDVLLNALSFSREFYVHKHIGDFTLFILGMFPESLSRKRGKEFILGRLIVPEASLSECYVIQGKRSYQIASEFTQRELFRELSLNFLFYKNVLDLVRIYLESLRDREFLKAKKIISGTD